MDATLHFIDPAGREWHTKASFASFLDRTVLPSLPELARVPGATVVKASLAREVVRLPWEPGSSVFAKRFRVRSTGEALKYTFTTSRAFAEWRIAHRLLALGLPCAEPLAVGERRRGPVLAEALYFCRGLERVVPLGGYLEARFRPGDGRWAEKRAALRVVLELLARMHRSGIYHSDFHGGNVLVREAGAAGSELEPFLVDLHSIHDPGAIFQWMRLRDLGDLLFSLRLALSRDELLAASADYGRLCSCEAEIAASIEGVLAARERRHVRSRSKRCLKESSLFTRSVRGRVSAHHRRDAPLDAILDAIAAHRRDVEQGGPGVLALSRRARVSVQQLGGRAIVVKEFLDEPPLRGRARRAYHVAHALLVRGVRAPQPIAWVRAERGHAYVLSEQLAHAPLPYFLYRAMRSGDGPPAPGRRRALAEALARAVAQLVRTGAEHRDLSAKNVLLDEALEVAFVDLEAVRLRRRIPLQRGGPPRRLLAALVQLGDLPDFVGPRDRLRFVAALERELPGIGLRPYLEGLARRIDARVFRRGTARRTPLAALRSRT